MQYSILDLAPVTEGSDTTQAIKNSVELAQHAEKWGYHRYWMAEHHNMPGIASAATSVLIGHIAGATSTMRIGAGGIMLPNHSPYQIAEQFGTLASIFPDRIDLGLGRAPGGDLAVARALRKSLTQSDGFPQDVLELMGYLGAPRPDALVRAHPGEGTHVPIWILGSSMFGAQLAAQLGLPYAFASHFAPGALEFAQTVYRRDFRPSAACKAPRFMLAINVFAADTDEEAAYLMTTTQLAFARLHLGMPGKIPPPVKDIAAEVPIEALRGANEALRVTAVGSPAKVRETLASLIKRYTPDEVILTGQIHDHAARLKSYRIAAEAMQDLTASADA